MLLNFYLYTTAASVIITPAVNIACINNLKRKGYEYTDEKKSFLEKLSYILSSVFMSLVPIYNVLNTTLILCNLEKYFEHIESKLLNESKISISNNRLESDLEIMTFNKKINNTEAVNKEKKYDDMPLEESIAYLKKEREFLLRQKETAIEKKPKLLLKKLIFNKKQG